MWGGSKGREGWLNGGGRGVVVWVLRMGGGIRGMWGGRVTRGGGTKGGLHNVGGLRGPIVWGGRRWWGEKGEKEPQ